MLILAATLAIAAPQQQQQTDTTIAVSSGGRLSVDAFNGSVRVSTWDREAVRIRGSHSASTVLDIDRRDSRISVEPESDHGIPDPVQLEITVPRRFDVEVEGMHLPITVDGVRGAVDVSNVEGAIIVRGVTGPVKVESVSGGITMENVRGNVDATSVNQAVQLRNVTGDVSAETVNGAIVMLGIDAASVEANTVNGLVEYQGSVRDGGRYYLGTHNGRLTMAIPERTNARLEIESFNGKVEAAFPVQLRRTGDREFDIVLGNGSASVELENFNGTIYLVRPGGR